MSHLRPKLRKVLSWSHTWLGLVAGVFIFVLAFSGGVVTFRPQIANLLSPAPVGASRCVPAVDWNRAEQEVESFAHSRINRIYTPIAPDPRYRFRMMTDQDAIYTHVIYDACAAKVLGTANLGWMDWMVDFHHNLRAERTGRTIAGWIGLLLLISGIGGILIWVISRPSLQRVFNLRSGVFLSRDLHRSAGLVAGCLLLVGSFTSLWLCFPQTMRAVLTTVVSVPDDVRVARPKKPAEGKPMAGLADIIRAAQGAIPDGVFQEIRLPDGYGNVQVRMWRPGDFRSLGNNVVTVDRITAAVVGKNLYDTKAPADRFMQAMAGLHYGEWGGLWYRSLYGLAGFTSALLLVTGVLTWWLPKRRVRAKASVREELPVAAAK